MKKRPSTKTGEDRWWSPGHISSSRRRLASCCRISCPVCGSFSSSLFLTRSQAGSDVSTTTTTNYKQWTNGHYKWSRNAPTILPVLPVKRGSSPVGYVRCSGVLCKYFEIILPALLIASNDLNHCAVARLRSHKTITTPIYGTSQPFAGHACMCVCVFLCLPWSFVGHPVNLVSRTWTTVFRSSGELFFSQKKKESSKRMYTQRNEGIWEWSVLACLH